MTVYFSTILFLILTAAAGATTVVVTPEDAFRDSLAMLGAGDTLYLSPGTYSIPDSLPLLHVRSSQDGIVITADPVSRPVLDGAGYPRSIVYLEGPLSGTTVVENLCLTGGSATSGSYFAGAGFLLTFSDCIVRNCSVSDCEALFGGGIYAEGGDPVLEWLEVSGNSAQVAGGGLGFYASNPVVRHAIVSDNTSGDDGGGIYATLGDLTLENVIITGNVSGDDGGGIMHLQGGVCDLQFLTIDSNTCLDDGAGVLASHVDSLIMYSCIVTSNSGNGGVGIKTGTEECLIVHCCVWDNGVTNYLYIPDPTGTLGNISEDPVYADELRRLSQTAAGQPLQSPAVDAGHGSAAGLVIESLSTRTDSLQDINIADMGFHYGPSDTSAGSSGSVLPGFGLALFPCPSSGCVTLRLSVDEMAQIDVWIWDACGRRLAPVFTFLIEGIVDVPWEIPRGTPAGIVLFRMSSEDRSASGSLVYLP